MLLRLLPAMITSGLIISFFSFSHVDRSADYDKISYISSSINHLSIVKMNMTEFYYSAGRFPVSMRELQLYTRDPIGIDGAKTFEILEDGILVIIFNKESGLDNGDLVLIPQVILGDEENKIRDIRWECTTRSFKQIKRYFPECNYI